MPSNSRQQRQAAISEIITQYKILTQQQLQKRMEERGISVSQSTLSRDIDQMHLTKKGGVYQADDFHPKGSELSDDITKNTVLSTDFAGNIAVIHCVSGTAGAVCVSIDAMRRDDVVGTIAGDDTVFVLLRTESQAETFAVSFQKGESACSQSWKSKT